MNQDDQMIAQLDKNENIYGPSPECYEVLNDVSMEDFICYSRESTIHKTISNQFGISEDRIILGYGAEDIIKNLFVYYLLEGDKVLLPDKSWWYFTSLSEQRLAQVHYYPLPIKDNEYQIKAESILEYKNQIQPKLTLICSPNNPTGSAIDIDEFEKILLNNSNGIICLDEAYWGFSKKDSTSKVLEYIEKYDNLIVIRSLSKYYALAGIRIAFAFCGKKLMNDMKFYHKVLGFNRLSERLALIAFGSDGYYKNTSRLMIDDREKLYHELNEVPGVTAYKSEANFILLKLSDPLFKNLDGELQKKGIIIKFFKEKGFPNCARITLGMQNQNQLILDIIKEVAALQA